MEANFNFDEIQPYTGESPGLPEPTPLPIPGVLAEATAQREIAEVQAAMTIAKRFPRNQIRASERIMTACQRPGLAEGALYSYSRGGTDITGPSIRLAEAIAQQWGNLQFGIRELEQRAGESTVEAYAWDLETNTRQSKVFQVRHVRHTKRGAYALNDPRDIYEMVANLGARRLRACILGIVPGDIVEAAVNQCEATLKAKADISPEAIQKMVKVFGDYGVSKEAIEVRIQRKLESITAAQVIALRKIYNSLKDGMSVVEDWFETAPASAPNGSVQTAPKERKPRSDKGQPRRTHEAPQEENLAPVSPSPTLPTEPGPNDVSAPPMGITTEQLEELDRAPLDLLEAAYQAVGIDMLLHLEELDNDSAQDLLSHLRRQ
jgi:hypothetical protein